MQRFNCGYCLSVENATQNTQAAIDTMLHLAVLVLVETYPIPYAKVLKIPHSTKPSNEKRQSCSAFSQNMTARHVFPEGCSW